MRNVSLTRQSGAALVETAFVLIYLLGLLFVGFQVGLIGYYQLAMDQGSQIQARATALGDSSDTSNSILTAGLPNLNHVNLGTPVTDNPLAITTNNVNFNFTNPNARTGGYTFDAPLPNVSSMTQNNGLLQLGNTPISVNSVAVEASVKELCPHYCLINGGLSAATAADTLNYFQNGDNTAPYFIGFDYMRTCLSNPSYDLTKTAPVLNTWSWDTCPANGTVWRALGTAAHLDESNNGYTLAPESLDRSYSGLQYEAPSRTQAGPFFELWCHRNMYAWIELNAFPDINTTPPLPNNALTSNAFLQTWLGTDPKTNLPLPGKIIYNAANGGSTAGSGDATASAGWDSTTIQGAATGQITYNATLSPWWGCGLLNGGT